MLSVLSSGCEISQFIRSWRPPFQHGFYSGSHALLVFEAVEPASNGDIVSAYPCASSNTRRREERPPALKRRALGSHHSQSETQPTQQPFSTYGESARQDDLLGYAVQDLLKPWGHASTPSAPKRSAHIPISSRMPAPDSILANSQTW